LSKLHRLVAMIMQPVFRPQVYVIWSTNRANNRAVMWYDQKLLTWYYLSM